MASKNAAPVSSSSVTFDVMLEEGPAEPKLPKRFQKMVKMDADESDKARHIQEKQLRAQQKKKELEAAKLDRIQKRREQCCHMASKMERLLAQDAKRHGMAGTECINPMSCREAGAIIQSVHRDFQRLGAELHQNLET